MNQRQIYESGKLQKQWELMSQKLAQLERERILETRPDERFRLDQKIAEIKAEKQQIEQQLDVLEQQGIQPPILTEVSEPSQGFYATIPKVYHNLPQPDYGNFVGREAELMKIERILQPYPHSQHAVVTIDGIGGIGKSALALEIAHRYLRNFDTLEPARRFEAIIWTSAKQTILTAEGISTRRQILRTLDDIYNAIAVALQREDITRARKEDQNAVVRNALTRQRTLLIVDNLETVDDEAVMDFLRELPAPTKAIVTTRHRLDVAYPVRLTGMPWEDAQLLIQQECEKKDVTLDEPNQQRLFDRTGGVPLAIVWIIAQMGMGYGVETVLNRLGQPTSDISRFCFEGAVERIHDKPAHKLLMVLSLCADSASRESVGYATGLLELDRDNGLVELEKLSLVNKKGDRFSLLPLTKQYAAAELEKSAEKERLREQWLQYFSKLSREYSSEYWNWRNYDWLLAEGDNIISIINWAIANSRGETALSFTRATKRYLDIQGRWSELAEYGERFYTVAQSLNDKRALAWISLNWLSWLYNNQEKMDDAKSFASQSLSLYRELDDKKGMCLAMSYLGRIRNKAPERKIGVELFDQAIQLAQEDNYGEGIATVHHELGKLARDRGQWEEARAHWKAMIDWCEEHKDSADLDISFIMGAIGNLGWVEFNLGDFHHSREHMEKSLIFFERLGGKGYLTTLYVRLATIEKTLGNCEKALQHAQKAYFWAERLGMVRELEGAKALLEELNVESNYKDCP